jgi:hypothetical protein
MPPLAANPNVRSYLQARRSAWFAKLANRELIKPLLPQKEYFQALLE